MIVYATDGNQGSLPEGESRPLADLRRAEAEASASVTGAQRLVWLPYHDSGMRGWDTNTAAGAFMQADVDAVARQLADVLDEEDADVLVGYDWHGGYGHPDHVQVHRVTRQALNVAQRRPRYLETTLNRDRMRRFAAVAAAQGYKTWDIDAPMEDGNPIGTPEAELHWSVDIAEQLPIKHAALAAHASQPDAAGMLTMPPEAFAAMFGREFFIEPGRVPGMVEGWPFA